MFDLQARIHLHEIKLLPVVHQKLHRSGARVVDGARRPDRSLGHRGAHLGPDPGRRRLFDDFLVAPLDGTVAIEQRQYGAVPIRQDLHLDVARMRKITLQQQAAVTERGARQTLRGFHRAGHLCRGFHHLHALAAAARARLDDQREADPHRLGAQPPDGLVLAVIPGRPRHAGIRHGRLCGALRPHGPDRRWRRSDERQAGVDAGLRESGIFGQKSITRVHAVGARAARHRDDPRRVQIAVGGRRRPKPIALVGHAYMPRAAVRVGKHRDRGDAHALRGAHDAAGDFPPIGDQQPSHGHMRNTPKRVGTMDWLLASCSVIPNTRRVSSGSMTPSSQSRADA